MKQNKMYAVIMLEIAKRCESDLSNTNYNKHYKKVFNELKEIIK